MKDHKTKDLYNVIYECFLVVPGRFKFAVLILFYPRGLHCFYGMIIIIDRQAGYLFGVSLACIRDF